jgi:hypothetical protein
MSERRKVENMVRETQTIDKRTTLVLQQRIQKRAPGCAREEKRTHHTTPHHTTPSTNSSSIDNTHTTKVKHRAGGTGYTSHDV